MQIASYGLADQYLTGTPQITFFKFIHRRHTLFATESIQQNLDGTADFGRKCTCQISRNGDLVGAVWLEVSLPDLAAYDITPTPAEGNSVDVTSAAVGLYKDPNGHYWQTLSNGVYTNPVGFYDPATGMYSYSAKLPPTAFSATQYVLSTGLYSDGGQNTASTVTPRTESGFLLPSWPYLVRVGASAPYDYDTPKADLRWTNSIGHALLASVEIEIGGSRIDRHVGEWLDVWSELTEKEEKRAGLWDMIGKYDEAEYDDSFYVAGDNDWRMNRAWSRARTYYIPLKFCFNTMPGMYLPLVALSYHQIKYNFEFRPYLECIRATVPVTKLTAKVGGDVLAMKACNVFADYCFLDAPERIRMAEIPHEYLITQVQFLGDEAVPAPSDPNGSRSRKFSLNYSHPVRELVWVYTAKKNYEVDAQTGNNWFKYDVPNQPDLEIFDECRLVINGHDRFTPRSAPYFRLVQPYEHHTRCPTKRVHCYSFSLLSPEDWQPSGQANWSRFDSAQLQFQLSSALPVGRMKIFAYSFNVLRVASGLAGLAFST